MNALTKHAHAACPKCGSMPAEYKMASEAFTRWKCHCGAEGRLASTETPATAPVKKVFPHWSTRRTT